MLLISLVTVQRLKEQRVLVFDSEPVTDGYFCRDVDTFVACSDGTLFVVYDGVEDTDEIDLLVAGRSYGGPFAMGGLHGITFSSPIRWCVVTTEHEVLRATETINP